MQLNILYGPLLICYQMINQMLPRSIKQTTVIDVLSNLLKYAPDFPCTAIQSEQGRSSGPGAFEASTLAARPCCSHPLRASYAGPAGPRSQRSSAPPPPFSPHVGPRERMETVTSRPRGDGGAEKWVRSRGRVQLDLQAVSPSRPARADGGAGTASQRRGAPPAGSGRWWRRLGLRRRGLGPWPLPLWLAVDLPFSRAPFLSTLFPSLLPVPHLARKRGT
jgi:hypothetical protein